VTRRTFSFDEALTLTMTPTAFSRDALAKVLHHVETDVRFQKAVRTSFSASSTVASSSSATPWNFCLAVRNPFVSVSNMRRGNLA